MYKILVASESFGYGAKKNDLLKLFKKYNYTPDFITIKKIGSRLKDYEAIIIGTEEFTGELFSKSLKLKAIIKYGIGTDNIDTIAAKKHNVEVLNLPSVNSITVAEMAMGLLFASGRKIVEADRFIRNKKWLKLIGLQIYGKTLGIIGTGSIGTILCGMVSGLKMKVLGYDLIRRKEFIGSGGKYVSFNSLLKKSDFISIHVPLNKKTYHLIGKKQLSEMKNNAILINVSRGSVVDEEALHYALKNNIIAGAALDVFEDESPEDNPIFKIENLVCTPHIAAYTNETLRLMDLKCLEKLSTVLTSRDF